jgi:BlaI family penicillinase repressor
MKLTPPEWKLMNVVWSGHPVTARGIAERLPDNRKWAYTTVKTMLSRLVSKGALVERKEGKTSLYDPLLTLQRARRQALQALASDVFDASFTDLITFLIEDGKLSAPEREKLAALLRAKRRKERLRNKRVR